MSTISTAEFHLTPKVLVSIFKFYFVNKFILLLIIVNCYSSYTKEIPFVLAIGIATSISNLHNSLPHHIVTKLKVKMFVSEASVVFLNHIMDQV